MSQKPYVQFSKRVVIAVCIAVTALTVCGMTLCYLGGDMEHAAEILKVYIQYAMVVFAAYSGNSAVEKWLTHRWGNTSSSDEDEESNG